MRDFNEKTGKYGPLKQNFWANAFSTFAVDRFSPSFQGLNNFFNSTTPESRLIQKLMDHCKKINIPSPSFVMNGHLIKDPQPHLLLFAFVNNQISYFRKLIQQQIVSDKTEDLHHTILSQSFVSKRYNSLIQSYGFCETFNLHSLPFHFQQHFVNWF